MNKPATVGQCIGRAKEKLETVSTTAELDARILFCHLSELSGVDLILKADQPVAAVVADQFAQLVEQRAGGVPVAYLTGTKEFWSLELKVTPDTLIPRPETELLVETALDLITHDQALAIADLGTGSGAIALAIAKERPGCHIIATDISRATLAVAAENAAACGLDNIEIIHSDWFGALGEHRFDVILANPPYIDMDNDEYDAAEIGFEPAAALFSENNGMAAISRIIGQAPAFLKAKGWIVLEHGNTQAHAVCGLLEDAGFTRVSTTNDLNRQPRISIARLPV